MFVRDEINKNVVTQAAKDLIAKGQSFISTMSDYGKSQVNIQNENFDCTFWKWKFENGIQHVVFQREQRVALLFRYKFLSGVQIDENGNVSLMSDQDLGRYD